MTSSGSTTSCCARSRPGWTSRRSGSPGPTPSSDGRAGTYSSRYYDLVGAPRSSALRNYAALGYRVVAVDRPGPDDAVMVPNEARDQIMFAGPVAAAVQQDAGTDLHPLPREELRGAITWHERMPVVGPALTVPVLHVLPELDGIWSSDEDARLRAEAALKGGARPVVSVQRHAGHCVDAHLAGWSHHLETAAFLEACRLDGAG